MLPRRPINNLNVDACVAEWYERNPVTGEDGWTLHSGWVRGTPAEVRAKLHAYRPLLGTIVSCYEAAPNPGDEWIIL